jgi:hypothetical protein
MVCIRVIRALRATERESHSHNPFDFGERLRFGAATETKIKISPGTPIVPGPSGVPVGSYKVVV